MASLRWQIISGLKTVLEAVDLDGAGTTPAHVEISNEILASVQDLPALILVPPRGSKTLEATSPARKKIVDVYQVEIWQRFGDIAAGKTKEQQADEYRAAVEEALETTTALNGVVQHIVVTSDQTIQEAGLPVDALVIVTFEVTYRQVYGDTDRAF